MSRPVIPMILDGLLRDVATPDLEPALADCLAGAAKFPRHRSDPDFSKPQIAAGAEEAVEERLTCLTPAAPLPSAP